MSADAQRFAQVVLDGFVAAGLHTDRAVGAAGGPSSSTMTLLRKVAAGEIDMAEPREPTWSKIDTAAHWSPGSARQVWNGGNPVGAIPDDEGYVAAPGDRVLSGVTDDQVLREIRAMREDVRALSERLAKLEEHGS